MNGLEVVGGLREHQIEDDPVGLAREGDHAGRAIREGPKGGLRNPLRDPSGSGRVECRVKLVGLALDRLSRLGATRP